MANGVKIDRRQLMVELSASEPVLKRVAEQTLRKAFFDPAVEQLKEDFNAHKVTEEIRGGVDANNDSGTLDAEIPIDGERKDRNAKPNLTSFIGFPAGSDPLQPIAERLDSNHQDGPKMIYKGKDKDNLTFRFEIRAPNEEAIYRETPMPWGAGDISWVQRIERGIPGIGYFLNSLHRKGSRSGGGIQVENQLRGGRFKPTSYLSALFNNFLRRVAGKSDNGRSV